MVEHCSDKAVVPGSNPGMPTAYLKHQVLKNSVAGIVSDGLPGGTEYGPVAQLARALALHARGHGFESHQVHGS